MLTRDWLEQQVADERLVRICPLIASTTMREFYATPEIAAELDPQIAIVPPWSEARAIIDDFIDGALMTVAHGKSNKRTTMGHLEPLSDGIWTIKPSKPKPGIRIAGRFVERDCFVALVWEDRNLLGRFGSRRWKAFAKQADARWRQHFNDFRPVKGSDSNEYVSNIILV